MSGGKSHGLVGLSIYAEGEGVMAEPLKVGSPDG
jgi:hypothetical protein